MIPLKDYNPTRTAPVVTLLLIAACVAVYFLVQPTIPDSAVQQVENETCTNFRFNLENAAIPYEITEGRPLTESEAELLLRAVGCETSETGTDASPGKSVALAVLYSMFLHGGFLHLAGNMLYLWVFGNNVEDVQGKAVYLAFYLLSGVAATITHVALNRDSPIPIVGASGAIAGVMGAYLVLFPRVPIRSLIMFFLVFLRDIEARWLLGFWFVSQFFINPNSGVAWAAHVGGFVFGVAGGLFWRARRPPRPSPRYAYDRPYL
ncbi:MAG TPA: rhomboid family intramembrane serine protease [Acidimicrobiales bacterium]|nr:rhomboid family intramembrane serine protease [Acidimicrobiales bacterium]